MGGRAMTATKSCKAAFPQITSDRPACSQAIRSNATNAKSALWGAMLLPKLLIS